MGWIWCSWGILLQHPLLSQASRDLAQMNDLQAQLEEANKEKQELQEKVGTRVSLGRERVPGSLCVGTNSQAHRQARASLCHQSASASAEAEAWSRVAIADVSASAASFHISMPSLVLSFLFSLQRAKSVLAHGRVGNAPGSGPHPSTSLCIPPSLPQPSSHHGDLAGGWGEREPAPSLSRLSSFFPSCPSPPTPQLQALQSQVEFLEQSMVDRSLVSRQEAKIRELETRLEFERTQVKRLEVGAHFPGQSSASRVERPQRLEPRMLSRARQARSHSAPRRPLPSCQAS